MGARPCFLAAHRLAFHVSVNAATSLFVPTAGAAGRALLDAEQDLADREHADDHDQE
jgi:hypothetical protein